MLLPYQKDRITSFLNPEDDKTGAGWHAHQSLTAIGNGQLFGEGFMQGTQNQFGFLPDQYSDFPFAVFARTGVSSGRSSCSASTAFACIWAIHVASQAKDRFGAAIAVGVGAIIFWHVVLNVGMAVGLLAGRRRHAAALLVRGVERGHDAGRARSADERSMRE